MRRETTHGRTSVIVRAAAAAALVVPLAVVAAACGNSATAARQTPPPVRIGAVYNLTGGQAPLDAPSLDGARLAVDRINARGGLLGRRVELLERDGQTDEADVRQAAASLIASGCSVLIGLSDTDQVLAAAPIAARAGIPFVTSGATSPLLPQQVPDWLFLACFGDNAQAAASAQYATDQLGARTAAILLDRDLDYTRLLAKYFGRSFRAQGGNVLVTADYAEAGDAVTRLADGARGNSKTETSGDDDADDAPGADGAPGAGAALQADVLFVAAAPDDAGRVIRELRAAGYRQPIMGGDSFDSEGLVKAAEKTGGKVYYTTHAGIGMSSAGAPVRRFDATYRAAYGSPPANAFAGLGYDTVGLVASAIRRADSVEPAAIRDALQATRHFSGVTGTLSYASDQGVPRKKVTIVCVGRRPVVVAQFTPGYVAEP
jgi:branched-chain amino acid transport system substrate-binding protein